MKSGPFPEGHEHPQRYLHKRRCRPGRGAWNFCSRAGMLVNFSSLTRGKHNQDNAVAEAHLKLVHWCSNCYSKYKEIKIGRRKGTMLLQDATILFQ